MLLASIRSFRICISHQSDCRIKVCISHQLQSVVFVLWFERCSNSSEVKGDSDRAVRKMKSSFRMENVGFSVFLTFFFTALYKKCDTTGQLKDITSPIVKVLLML